MSQDQEIVFNKVASLASDQCASWRICAVWIRAGLDSVSVMQVTDLAKNNRCAWRHGRRRLSPRNSMTGEPEDFHWLVCTPSSHTLELPELWLSLGKTFLFYSPQRGVSQCAASQWHEKQSQDTSNSPAFFSTNSSSSLQQLCVSSKSARVPRWP